jgi:hypothetical protein
MNPEKIISSSIKLTGRIWFFLGLLSQLLFVYLIVVFMRNTLIFARLGALLFSIPLFFTSLKLLFEGGKLLFFPKSTFYQQLTGSINDLKWIYKLEAKLKKGGAYPRKKMKTVIIADKNGRRRALLIKRENLEDFFAFLKKNNPQLVFGYTLQKEKTYKKDPLSL